MKIFHGTENANIMRPTVLTLGVFDGLHLGHQRIMQTVVERAEAVGAIATAITFDPHPRAVLHPETAPPLLQFTMAGGGRVVQDGVGPVLGTAQNPLSREQLVAKCRALMEPVLGPAQTGQLIERVMTLETSSNVRVLRPLLQHARREGPPRLAEYPAE